MSPSPVIVVVILLASALVSADWERTFCRSLSKANDRVKCLSRYELVENGMEPVVCYETVRETISYKKQHV